MSLTDELIADLEELGDDVVESSEDEEDEEENKNNHGDQMDEERDINGEEERDDFAQDLEALSTKDITKIAKLYNSRNFQETLRNVSELKKTQIANISGPIEQHPEYKLIVTSNKLAVDVDNEITVIHKFIRDIYAAKFPELESLVHNPIDYAKVVKLLGNDMDLTNIDLTSILPPATVMVVTVTSTTTSGQKLSEEDLKAALDACDMMLNLDQAKRELLSYVEARMNFIAPNLTHIVGSGIAAKLMGAAGGLASLAKMPACNILSLGGSKKNLAGFSTSNLTHNGFIYSCDILQTTPPDLRKKTARTIAGKCALAARVDSCHESRGGTVGAQFLDLIHKRVDKLQEAPNAKQARALPVPLEAPKRKRGGKRARKMKEKYAVTEYRKMQNRMTFGTQAEEETGFMDETKGMGMMNGTGKIRALTADSRSKLSVKKTAETPVKSYGGGASSAVSGLASSVVFTPVKGFEINNPNMTTQEEKVRLANEKYFSSMGGFLKVGKKGDEKKQ